MTRHQVTARQIQKAIIFLLLPPLLPHPTQPPPPTLEGISRTSPDKTQENMLSIDLFIIHILNTRTHTPTHRRKEPNKMEWKKLMNLLLLPTTTTHSFKKPREKELDDNQTPFLARE
jgi:hypothetical protein